MTDTPPEQQATSFVTFPPRRFKMTITFELPAMGGDLAYWRGYFIRNVTNTLECGQFGKSATVEQIPFLEG